MRLTPATRSGRAVAASIVVLALFSLAGCRPTSTPDGSSNRTARDPLSSTPLPTRQTTIDPVTKKLDAAQQDAERRRSDIDQAGK